MAKHKVKLISPWHSEPLTFGDVCFDPNVPLEQADAALWQDFPDETILTYQGPKAWLSGEPQWHSQYRSKLVRTAKAVLREGEWLHYAHPNPEFRVPHMTNCGSTRFYDMLVRLNEAVAVVSNTGGRIWFLRPGLRFRNHFVTHPLVRLHGRLSSWSQFRKWGPLSSPSLPANYVGELNWDHAWMSEDQVTFLSKYKVAVCLENSIEPYYFTEKFLNAARAGCVPIYRAHQTVRDGILKGAFWIDPADHGLDATRTIKAALAAPLEEVHAKNRAWMASPAVEATHFNGVWKQLAGIFSRKLSA
jgi:hypothetical protein